MVWNQLAISSLLQTQPCCFLHLHAKTNKNSDELTRIPCFGSLFWIFTLVILSFLISVDLWKLLFHRQLFLGLPEQGKFATEPVRHSFLIKQVIPERLIHNPSLFKTLTLSPPIVRFPTRQKMFNSTGGLVKRPNKVLDFKGLYLVNWLRNSRLWPHCSGGRWPWCS